MLLSWKQSKYQQHSAAVGNKNSSVHFSPMGSKLMDSNPEGRVVNFKVKSHESISKMAEFLGSEFGSYGEGSPNFKGHELILNEENMKKSAVNTLKAISKSSSRDCLDGRKVSLASMPSPKNTKHFRSVDDSKSDSEKESKVEIKITDGGILVISDKETTV